MLFLRLLSLADLLLTRSVNGHWENFRGVKNVTWITFVFGLSCTLWPVIAIAYSANQAGALSDNGSVKGGAGIQMA